MPRAKPKAAGGRHITRDSNAEILTKDNAQLDLQILCTTKTQVLHLTPSQREEAERNARKK